MSEEITELSSAEAERELLNTPGEIENVDLAASATGESPDWAPLPPGLKIPVGVTVAFMRIPKWMKQNPATGETVIVLWPITLKEERLARKRSMGDSDAAVDELCKVSVRVIDGAIVDWSKGGHHVNAFINSLNMLGIGQLRNWFARTHTMSTEQQQDFFANHFSVRTAVGG